MSKNILFSNTSWRSHLMRETAERKSAEELKEDKSNKVTSFQSKPDHEHYASEKLLFDSLMVISEKIVSEINRAYESENFIYNELLKEKSFAENSDAALQAMIETEENRAANAEYEINTRLDTIHKFIEYRNILLLNSLLLHGYSTSGAGEQVEASEIISGCYDRDGNFCNDVSMLTSIYNLSFGKAYRLNCLAFTDSLFANIILFDCNGNSYSFNINLKGKIFIPDKCIARIGLSYAATPPTVEAFDDEQIVANIAEGSVTEEKLSDGLLDKIKNIAHSVSVEMSRATLVEKELRKELDSQSLRNINAFGKVQSQLENEIIRSTVVDKNLLKRVESLENRIVILTQDEYDSIEYKDDGVLYFILDD